MALLLKVAFAEIRKAAGQAAKDLHFWYCPDGPNGEPLIVLQRKKLSPSDIETAKKQHGIKSSKACRGLIGLHEDILKLRVTGKAVGKLEKGVKQVAADNGLRVSVVQIVEDAPEPPDVDVGEDDEDIDPASQRAQIGEAPDEVLEREYRKALRKAQGAIHLIRQHPHKRLQLTDLMTDMRDKAERRRFAEASEVLKRIVALSKMKEAERQQMIAQAVERVKVPDDRITEWETQHGNWEGSIDLASYQLSGGTAGQGGMGQIRVLGSNKTDAPPLVLKTGGGLDNEARIYDQVGPHPNIARCLGIQQVGNQQGLVLEALKGGDMSQAIAEMNDLRAQGKLSDQEYWGVMQFTTRRTLEALAFMQQKGVVHKDIKPPNIMFDEDGEPKLVDMGIASKTDEATMGMTFGYVPAGMNEDPTKRDTFATGSSLFEVGRGNTGAQADGSKRFKYGKKEDEQAGFMDAGRWSQDDKSRALLVSDDPDEVYETDDKGVPTKKHGAYASNTAYVDFVNWLMHPDHEVRPSPAEALAHPFLQQSMLGDDDAKAVLKRLIDRRQGGDAPAPVDADKARANMAGAIRQANLSKTAEEGSKRAAQVAKLAQALAQKAAKPGAELLSEEVERYEQLADGLEADIQTLMRQRTDWTDAAQALSKTMPTKAPADKAQAKLFETDMKTMRVVSDAATAAQDALMALQKAVEQMREATTRARQVAKAPWAAGNLALTADAWGAMKKEAIKFALKDEATGMTPALTAVDKLRAEFGRNPSAKITAGLKLALDKLIAKLQALAPVTTLGNPHRGMQAYRDGLLAKAQQERQQLDG